jgi:transglutaminase-like putative cysteine protease
MRSLFLVLITLAIFPVASWAQNNKPRTEKVPSWVTVNTPAYTNTKLDAQADDGYIDLLYDKQVSVGSQSTYYKRSIKILSESGVQNASEVNVSFDPSYSQLVFHTINIIRGSETINKLQLAKIKTIQQESELNRYLYNGSLSSVLFLEDVRKGDVIEYSYTLKGTNPVFKGKYADQLETSFGIPVYSLFYKVVMPKGRALQIKNSNTDIKYTEQQGANETTYEWKAEKLSAVHPQDRLPAWYDPYGTIMLSEYKDWKEVNDWAMQLFPFSGKPSPVLQKKISEIQKADTSVEKQILAALRFVQDDVRYLGIEMGDRSHKPHHPDQVFTQRFGDCKDKSYLLCTMLKALKVEAYPVLINTTYKKTITGWLPSPGIFDHCTVYMQYAGRTYWFDPTIAYQRGRLRDIAYPDYQYGLVISDSTHALTSIASSSNKGMVDIKEEFNIPAMTGAARLLVKTTYSGSFADDMRSDFNSSSIYEIQKRFRNFYAGYFDGIKTDSVTYTEDEKAGKLITREYYTIDSFWAENDGIKKASFAPFVINSLMGKPSDVNRTMPFRIMYPAKYEEEVVINLPENWDPSDMMEEVDCPAFKMRGQAFYNDKQFRLKYEYESLKDHVLPGEAAGFFKKYEDYQKNFSYALTKRDDKVASKATPAAKRATGNTGFIIIAVLLISGLILWWTQRR